MLPKPSLGSSWVCCPARPRSGRPAAAPRPSGRAPSAVGSMAPAPKAAGACPEIDCIHFWRFSARVSVACKELNSCSRARSSPSSASISPWICCETASRILSSAISLKESIFSASPLRRSRISARLRPSCASISARIWASRFRTSMSALLRMISSRFSNWRSN